VEKAITELYKLDIDDPPVCRRRAEYLLEQDRFTYPLSNYRVAFQHFTSLFRTVVRLNPCNLADSQFSLRFVGPQIPDAMYAEYYSSPRKTGMMDKRFLRRIDAPFICLTAAILCHSWECWGTGNFIDNVAFTCASSKGKANNANLRFSQVSGSFGAQAPRHPDTVENRKYLKW